MCMCKCTSNFSVNGLIFLCQLHLSVFFVDGLYCQPLSSFIFHGLSVQLSAVPTALWSREKERKKE